MPKKKVGLWLSSSPTKSLDFKKGCNKLKNLGIDYVLPESSKRYLYATESHNRSFLAGPDLEKVRAFRELWNNPQIEDILAIRGGYGVVRILPLLDKVKLKKDFKKCLWGFSDLTCIQHYIYGRMGNSWVHAPMLTSPSFHSPLKKEKAWMEKADRKITLQLKNSGGKPPKEQKILFLGGNLVSLVSLLGTPWEPIPSENFLLFLEDVGEEGRYIDRAMFQLMNSRFFKRCQGIVSGYFTDCPKGKHILHESCKEKKVNLWTGLPSGHERPNLAIPLGKRLTLNRKSRESYVLELPNFRFGC